MPFTANRQFKAAPRLFESASGMYYRDVDGNQVLDGAAGLWCVNAGHGRKEIADAVARQLITLDYAPPFNMGHPLAFEFAERLGAIAPGAGDAKLDRIFFAGSGSEAVDTALKIAIAYQRAIGQGTRTRVVGRERAYHGVGFGGISVGGLVNNRRMFPQLPGSDHMRHTHDLARNAFSRGLPAHGAELADDLERLVALNGAETIAAVIVEREIATRHGIVLIFDEVITGFGRLGTPFAADYFGVTPDLMTTAKGLTNGAIPMGAVFAARKIHDALMQGPPGAIELFHGYTYSGHPVACAAGLATLDIYANEKLLTRGAEIGKSWEAIMFGLKDLPNVIDIRTLGLVTGIELKPRDGAVGARGHEVLVECFKAGLLVRVTGDIIALSPPLILEQQHMETMAETLVRVLRQIA